MANYNNFHINSNFPTDLIVFSYSATIPLDQYYGSIEVAHNLAFTPLPFGLYSLDNGTTWNDIDYTTVDGGSGFVTADPTNLVVSLNVYPVVASSALIRVFAFAPSTASSVIVTPPAPLSKFYLDSRKTHELLIASGRTVLPNYNGAQTVYTHNLGYLPRVMLWRETPDGLITRPFQWNKETASGYEVYFYPILTTTELKFNNYASYAGESVVLHWRVYGGEK